MPVINAAGLAIVKEFEGCELGAYADATGIPTIGYGHTGSMAPIGWARDLRLGDSITQEQADELLEFDLGEFQQGVQNLTRRNLTPNEFSALVSFAYNVGLGTNGLGGSKLMELVNSMRPGNVADQKAAADEFLKWTYAGDDQLEGLVRRRSAERALFIAP